MSFRDQYSVLVLFLWFVSTTTLPTRKQFLLKKSQSLNSLAKFLQDVKKILGSYLLNSVTPKLSETVHQIQLLSQQTNEPKQELQKALKQLRTILETEINRFIELTNRPQKFIQIKLRKLKYQQLLHIVQNYLKDLSQQIQIPTTHQPTTKRAKVQTLVKTFPHSDQQPTTSFLASLTQQLSPIRIKKVSSQLFTKLKPIDLATKRSDFGSSSPSLSTYISAAGSQPSPQTFFTQILHQYEQQAATDRLSMSPNLFSILHEPLPPQMTVETFQGNYISWLIEGTYLGLIGKNTPLAERLQKYNQEEKRLKALKKYIQNNVVSIEDMNKKYQQFSESLKGLQQGSETLLRYMKSLNTIKIRMRTTYFYFRFLIRHYLMLEMRLQNLEKLYKETMPQPQQHFTPQELQKHRTLHAHIARRKRQILSICQTKFDIFLKKKLYGSHQLSLPPFSQVRLLPTQDQLMTTLTQLDMDPQKRKQFTLRKPRLWDYNNMRYHLTRHEKLLKQRKQLLNKFKTDGTDLMNKLNDFILSRTTIEFNIKLLENLLLREQMIFILLNTHEYFMSVTVQIDKSLATRQTKKKTDYSLQVIKWLKEVKTEGQKFRDDIKVSLLEIFKSEMK